MGRGCKLLAVSNISLATSMQALSSHRDWFSCPYMSNIM